MPNFRRSNHQVDLLLRDDIRHRSWHDLPAGRTHDVSNEKYAHFVCGLASYARLLLILSLEGRRAPSLKEKNGAAARPWRLGHEPLN